MRFLILDTGPALLYVIGRLDPSMIRRHKRLDRYRADDFYVLNRFVLRFETLMFSPNVLSEISNLSVQGVNGDAEFAVRTTLAAVIAATDEIYIESRKAAARSEYVWLGLTDAGLLGLCGPDRVLLTSDARLHAAALSANHDSLNFEQLRYDR